jgi:hypothetical protein
MSAKIIFLILILSDIIPPQIKLENYMFENHEVTSDSIAKWMNDYDESLEELRTIIADRFVTDLKSLDSLKIRKYVNLETPFDSLLYPLDFRILITITVNKRGKISSVTPNILYNGYSFQRLIDDRQRLNAYYNIFKFYSDALIKKISQWEFEPLKSPTDESVIDLVIYSRDSVNPRHSLIINISRSNQWQY